MQNEEKILGLLEQLVEDVSGLKQESAETKKELAALKEQTDVDMLKTVVRLHSQDISALKKAR